MNGTFFVTLINDFLNENGKTGDSHPQAEQNDGFTTVVLLSSYEL